MKAVLRHFCIWVLWFFMTNFYSFTHLKQEYILATVFNCLSFMALFYASYFLSKSYKHNTAGVSDNNLSRWGYITAFLFRWEIPVLLFVLGGNVALSWAIDHYLYSVNLHPGVTPKFWYYAEGKFAREAFYTAVAYVFADKQISMRKKDEIILVQNEKMRLVVKEKNNVVNFYNKEIKGMKAILKRLKDKDSETGTDG